MKPTITAIHLDSPQKAKDYANEKVTRLLKYGKGIEKIEVRLIGQKSHRNKDTDFDCEIKIVVPGHDLEIKETQRTIEAAIDKAQETAKHLLVKNKEKRTSKKHNQGVITKLLGKFRS